MINKIKQKKPIILCITNNVVMNFTANILLAIGASPIMSLDKNDISDLSKICNGILINIGTLDNNFIELSRVAIECGINYGLPIIFDPVGSGASEIRTRISREISKINYDKLIVKGNASEIISLSDNIASKGVDSNHPFENAINLAKKMNQIICITGKDDYVIFGEKIIKISNGSKILQQITGTGCALGAVICAFLSIDFSLKNIANAMSFFSIAGEIADENSNGIGSFGINFLDALSSVEDKIFEKRKKIYEN